MCLVSTSTTACSAKSRIATPPSISDWQIARLMALSKFGCGIKKSLFGVIVVKLRTRKMHAVPHWILFFRINHLSPSVRTCVELAGVSHLTWCRQADTISCKLALMTSGLDREQALLDVIASIMSRSTLTDLFRDLTQKLSRFVPFDRMVLLLYDEAREEFVSAESYAAFPPELPLGYISPRDQTPAGEVILSQKRFHIPDVSVETRYPKLISMFREMHLHALCYLPLTTPTRRIGALVLATVSEIQYSDAELSFLEEVLKPVAIAVENILNLQRLATERDRLKLLLQINNDLVTELDLQALFEQVSEHLKSFVPHDYFWLALWDPEHQQLRLRVATTPEGMPSALMDLPIPLENSPGGEAFTSGEPQIFDSQRLSGISGSIKEIMDQRHIRSVCSIPLRSAHGKIGVIGIGSQAEAAYSMEIVEPLEAITSQLAIAVENATAFHKLGEMNRLLNETKLYLEEELADATSEEILGSSPGIRKVLQQIETVAATDATVLVYGETGCGKELVARALHQKSPRGRAMFVKLNCAAIPMGLLPSELFGHEQGVHRSHRPESRPLRDCSRRLAVPGRNRRSSAGAATQTTACSTGEGIRTAGRKSDHPRGRASDRGDQSRLEKDGGSESVSQRSVLPAQRVSHLCAAAAGTQRGYPDAGDAFHSGMLPPLGEKDPGGSL